MINTVTAMMAWLNDAIANAQEQGKTAEADTLLRVLTRLEFYASLNEDEVQ